MDAQTEESPVIQLDLYDHLDKFTDLPLFSPLTFISEYVTIILDGDEDHSYAFYVKSEGILYHIESSHYDNREWAVNRFCKATHNAAWGLEITWEEAIDFIDFSTHED